MSHYQNVKGHIWQKVANIPMLTNAFTLEQCGAKEREGDTCCDELCHVSGLVYPQQYLCRFSAFLTTLSVTNGLQQRPLV